MYTETECPQNTFPADDLLAMAERILAEYKEDFEELAK